MGSRFFRGQVSLELITTVGFVLLIFIVVLLLALEKSGFAYNLKLFLNARSVAKSLAVNVNTISEQSAGYFRYVSFPSRLFGDVDYDLSASEDTVSIIYGGDEWTEHVISANVTLFCLDKGEGLRNRIENTGKAVIITCSRPNLVFEANSFTASSSKAGENATVSVVVEDRSHVAAPAFTVRLNQSSNATVASLASGARTRVPYNITVPPAGTASILFEIDPEGSVNETIEGDNNLTVVWTTA